MAGTRGIARFRGEQLNDKLLRNNHFDETSKIDEKYVATNFHNHREILEDTKIDVFVQANNKATAGLSGLDVSADVGARSISTGANIEGVVLTEKVVIRATGTDTPISDVDGDVVYGRLEEAAGVYTLKFYSLVSGTEQPFNFPAGAGNVDYRFVVRTNLSIVPVDAIIKGGSGFVEGATDAKAYMNLIQLMKDVYGATGTLDNDGNANLTTSIQGQISKEIQDRTDADTAISNNLAATTGAGLVGVITDTNYTGLTVQAVLSNLAQRLKGSEDLTNGISTREANSANGYFLAGDFVTAEGRVVDLETKVDAELKNSTDRILKLETEEEEEVYEATGGETSYNLVNGRAKSKTVMLFINGQLQTPGVNFVYIKNGSNEITGFDFSPDTLKITNGVPDTLFVKYNKIL